MHTFQVIWFVLWGVLWTVYFMLDGFVLGTGMLHRFVARSDVERRALVNILGPVWDGNEVWLLTAGGATFAAFPGAYASMFSYLYTALLLLLFSLIVRGVSFEFRGKLDSTAWRATWDAAIQVTSFLPALLFGVAFGNIFRGLPIDAAGYHGSLLALLNPYGVVTGLLFVLLFLVHGALYIAVKTDGVLKERGEAAARAVWPALLAVAAGFLAYTGVETRLFDNYFAFPPLFALPGAAVAALVWSRVLMAKGRWHAAFFASCATVVAVVATGVSGLFPNLLPSRIDPAWSLTIFNSSSSEYTLKIMTGVALLFVPVVIAYKIWVYRVFRHPVTAEEVAAEAHPY